MEIDDNTKKELLGHFIYQVGMMRRCFYRTMESSFMLSNSEDRFDEDLMVAFLVHIRVFYEFFIKPNGIESHAKDYIPEWKVNDLEMDKLYQQINSYLHHLDYERVIGKRGGWEHYKILKLYTYFRNLIINFITKLPPNFTTPELTKLSETLKKEIGVSQS